MDITAELNKIIVASINKVQTTEDESILKHILFLTTNLLLILDTNKSANYKIAIIVEYIEGMQKIINGINQSTIDFLQALPSDDLQRQTSERMHKILLQYIDPESIDPGLVTFWLQRTCNAQELKCMDALMMFLNKEQQKKVMSYDQAFLQDPRLQLLRRCLPITY